MRRPFNEAAAGSFPNLPSPLQQICAHRELDSEDQLRHELTHLLPFQALSQIDQAAELLATALMQQQRLLIVADFDADGATSCALAIRALKQMGALNLHYLVPNRFDYGYGLSPEIVNEAQRFSPDLIITVDNGISSISGVARARELGIRVLITDHHLPGERLPAADVIVNPNSRDDRFASKNLAGVGVIFYVMAALRSNLRAKGWFDQPERREPNLADLLDLVALGTVADVVKLDYNNRILVHQGLKRIRTGHCCEGIRSLAQVAGRSLVSLQSSDLGFSLGPRLNAAGRLDDMSLGIECLLCEDPTRAMQMATELNQLNLERREIEKRMKEEAMADMASLAIDQDQLPPGIVVYRKEWHQGVIGILASRIKERYNRPVIAFAAAGPGQLKGSARSIPGLHIRDLLDNIARTDPQVLERFGGHAMAAGLSLDESHLEPFTRLFNDEVVRITGGRVMDDVIASEGELERKFCSMDFVHRVKELAPWGQGFPEPVFDGHFSVIRQRIVGEHHLKLRLCAENSWDSVDAIAFGQAVEEPLQQIHAAYRIDINEYRGVRKVQLVIEHFNISHPGGNT